MVNKGKDKSWYFFEFEYMPDHPDSDTANDKGCFLGIAPELTDLNAYNRDSGFSLRCDSGYFLSNGWNKVMDQVKKGTKVAFLVDMYEGSVKVFINGEDKGWMMENVKKLSESPYLVTVFFYKDACGTVRFIHHK